MCSSQFETTSTFGNQIVSLAYSFSGIYHFWIKYSYLQYFLFGILDSPTQQVTSASTMGEEQKQLFKTAYDLLNTMPHFQAVVSKCTEHLQRSLQSIDISNISDDHLLEWITAEAKSVYWQKLSEESQKALLTDKEELVETILNDASKGTQTIQSSSTDDPKVTTTNNTKRSLAKERKVRPSRRQSATKDNFAQAGLSAKGST